MSLSRREAAERDQNSCGTTRWVQCGVNTALASNTVNCFCPQLKSWSRLAEGLTNDGSDRLQINWQGTNRLCSEASAERLARENIGMDQATLPAEIPAINGQGKRLAALLLQPRLTPSTGNYLVGRAQSTNVVETPSGKMIAPSGFE